MSLTNTWPEPKAWLYGFVDTSTPGYRKFTVNIASGSPSTSPTLVTVPDGYYSYPEYLSAVNSVAASAASASVSVDAIGRVTVTGTAPLTWVDRLGWFLGLGTKPGDTSGTSGSVSVVSGEVPPAGVPLMSATWTSIDKALESTVTVDRHKRGHGYLFGENDVVRVTVLMHVQSLRAFLSGWVYSGEVILSGKAPNSFASDSPWSPTNTDGYLRGYVIGVEKGKWVDDTQTLYRTDLLLTRS